VLDAAGRRRQQPDDVAVEIGGQHAVRLPPREVGEQRPARRPGPGPRPEGHVVAVDVDAGEPGLGTVTQGVTSAEQQDAGDRRPRLRAQSHLRQVQRFS
jgi:hypothetical protein